MQHKGQSPNHIPPIKLPAARPNGITAVNTSGKSLSPRGGASPSRSKKAAAVVAAAAAAAAAAAEAATAAAATATGITKYAGSPDHFSPHTARSAKAQTPKNALLGQARNRGAYAPHTAPKAGGRGAHVEAGFREAVDEQQQLQQHLQQNQQQSPEEIEQLSLFESLKKNQAPQGPPERGGPRFQTMLHRLMYEIAERNQRTQVTTSERYLYVCKLIEAIEQEAQGVSLLKAFALLKKELPKLYFCRNTRVFDVIKRIMNFKISYAEMPKSYPELLEIIEQNFEQFDDLMRRRADEKAVIGELNVKSAQDELKRVQVVKDRADRELHHLDMDIKIARAENIRLREKFAEEQREIKFKFEQRKVEMEYANEQLIQEVSNLQALVTTLRLEKEELQLILDGRKPMHNTYAYNEKGGADDDGEWHGDTPHAASRYNADGEQPGNTSFERSLGVQVLGAAGGSGGGSSQQLHPSQQKMATLGLPMPSQRVLQYLGRAGSQAGLPSQRLISGIKLAPLGVAHM